MTASRSPSGHLSTRLDRRLSRRSFLRGLGAGIGGLGAAAALSPLIRVRPAYGGGAGLATRRVVLVAIGGGLRNHEALGMAEGATMPNLFGRVPVIPGYGAGDAGDVRIAPEYAAAAPPLVLPAPRAQPLYTDGTLITNLRYAEGAPGHLQGHGCLLTGFYNNIENRADARLPVPTVFEVFRRETGAAANQAWYVSILGGFYRALQASDNPAFGARFGGRFLTPPAVMSPIVPIVASGRRRVDLSSAGPLSLPVIPRSAAEDRAARRLTAVLDGNFPAFPEDVAAFRATAADNAAVADHLAAIYGDDTYEAFFPDSFGIGVAGDDGIDATSDALTVYHAEQILAKFKPGVLAMTLLDIDAAHNDFNGYLRGQQVADACVAHLWDFIQSTDGLRDETALIILPEHGRHLFSNGQNPDSLGRSGVDHGQGDDGDRDVWMMALGPDIRPDQVIAPTGVTQPGRNSGRYETIDATMTAMTLLGMGGVMESALAAHDARPGLVIEEVLR